MERYDHKPRNATATGGWKRQGMDCPQRQAQGKHSLAGLGPRFGFLLSVIVTECISAALSHHVCGYLLQQPQETNSSTLDQENKNHATGKRPWKFGSG